MITVPDHVVGIQKGKSIILVTCSCDLGRSPFAARRANVRESGGKNIAGGESRYPKMVVEMAVSWKIVEKESRETVSRT
jgi:hypothetical protein